MIRTKAIIPIFAYLPLIITGYKKDIDNDNLLQNKNMINIDDPNNYNDTVNNILNNDTNYEDDADYFWDSSNFTYINLNGTSMTISVPQIIPRIVFTIKRPIHQIRSIQFLHICSS